MPLNFQFNAADTISMPKEVLHKIKATKPKLSMKIWLKSMLQLKPSFPLMCHVFTIPSINLNTGSEIVNMHEIRDVKRFIIDVDHIAVK